MNQGDDYKRQHPAATIRPLHVDGTLLKDCEGNTVQLRGISTHGLGWYPEYINRECFHQFVDEFHCNVIRLAMYTAEDAGYCTRRDQAEQKALIRRGVEYAEECGIYVIIDWHILSDNNPAQNESDAITFFQEMSAEYKDKTHVIYEICNEPNGDVSWQEVKAYAERVISVIRENDKDAVIIVGTPEWSQRVDQACKDPIHDDNIMYTLHFYAGTHKAELRKRMTEAVGNGFPVFVSEYGICDASGNGALNLTEAQRWIDEMDRLKISYLAWNLSNKKESSAFLRPECKKTYGFTQEDLTESGLWVKNMLSAHIHC